MPENECTIPRDAIDVPSFPSSPVGRMLKQWAYSEKARIECPLSLIAEMSSRPLTRFFPPDFPIPDIISIVGGLILSNDFGLAATVIFVYDCVLTFSREVNLFWTIKPTGASVLFFLIRYSSLAFELGSLAELNPSVVSDQMQDVLHGAHSLLHLRYMLVAAFSGLRSYALTQSWWFSTAVFVLSLGPAAVNIAQYVVGWSGVVSPIRGCSGLWWDSSTEYLLAPLVIADFLLIVATWRTLRPGAEPILKTLSRRSIVAAMWWNGTIYFVVLFVLNVLHLSFTLASVFDDGTAPSNITTLSDPLTAVLISHFLLDLQEVSQRDVQLDTHDVGTASTDSSTMTLNFARAVGSIATTLRTDNATVSLDPDDDIQKRTCIRELKCRSLRTASNVTPEKRRCLHSVDLPFRISGELRVDGDCPTFTTGEAAVAEVPLQKDSHPHPVIKIQLRLQ
ncbi:hypothetical protein C8T65DRAFT_741037 [Cerioporus squamosus]|nr:hypothetical protein C8T65DRAFT_741037 [Cerioporus squamosus]